MTSHQGLTNVEASRLLSQYGENTLPRKERISVVRLFFNQFLSPLIYVLIAAGGITFALGDISDAAVITLAILVNTIMGCYQELKAEKALEALSSMVNHTARIMRDGEVQDVATQHIVPGDVIMIAQGNKIPADGILLESINFSADESMLTGESTQVIKKQDSEVYMGTIALTGRAVMRVVRTGQSTRMGTIAADLLNAQEPKTPLQLKLDQLARILASIVLILSVVILVIGLLLGRTFLEMFTTSVAVAVAAIPEGMAISLTVILALGMQKILKRKALVRKLVAAETLGSVTVIATDKTGTLTEGKMRVVTTDVIDQEKAMYAAILANNITGPLEIALWEWGYSLGYDPQKITDSRVREAEVPFNSEHKYMSVTIDGSVYYKGAPEVLLRKMNMDEHTAREILNKTDEWSKNNLRVVALAQSDKDETNFEWIGLLGLEDPVRENLAEVFDQTRSAGIRIVMLTGDYAGTAEAVWRKTQGSSENPRVLDGASIETMSPAQLRDEVVRTDIFARVTPNHKLRIVEALQKNNEVVALVGDGVNDAPALKRANIGIVVAEASDVSKETADIVLLDSNFRTIVAAVEEGRGIFENLKKVVLYLISDSFTQVFLVMGTLLLGLPLPLTAAQILWINVITDGLPAIALSAEAHDQKLLEQKPNTAQRSIIDAPMRTFIVLISMTTAIVGLITFVIYLPKVGLDTARTITFSVLGLSTLLYIFSIRTLHKPMWSKNLFNNTFLIVAFIAGFLFQIFAVAYGPLQTILKTRSLSLTLWLTVALYTFFVIAIIEIFKLVLRNRKILQVKIDV